MDVIICEDVVWLIQVCVVVNMNANDFWLVSIYYD